VIKPQISDDEVRASFETATPMSHQDEQVKGAVSQEIPSTVVDLAVEPTRLPESYVAHVRMLLLQELEGCVTSFPKYALSSLQLTF